MTSYLKTRRATRLKVCIGNAFMAIMTHAKFHFNRLMLTLSFDIWASESPQAWRTTEKPGSDRVKNDLRNVQGRVYFKFYSGQSGFLCAPTDEKARILLQCTKEITCENLPRVHFDLPGSFGKLKF